MKKINHLTLYLLSVLFLFLSYCKKDNKELQLNGNGFNPIGYTFNYYPINEIFAGFNTFNFHFKTINKMIIYSNSIDTIEVSYSYNYPNLSIYAKSSIFERDFEMKFYENNGIYSDEDFEKQFKYKIIEFTDYEHYIYVGNGGNGGNGSNDIIDSIPVESMYLRSDCDGSIFY